MIHADGRGIRQEQNLGPPFLGRPKERGISPLLPARRANPYAGLELQSLQQQVSTDHCAV